MNKRNVRSGLGPDRVRVEGSSPEAFARACNLWKTLSAGILGDLLKHKFAMSPSEGRREKDRRARVRKAKQVKDQRKKNERSRSKR
jgi:hypothetical protein